MRPRRPATLKEVAALAGVGTATVSRVFTGNGYASRETRERILTAAADLGYRPSSIARGLKLQRTEMLGLVIADITNPFYSYVASGALQAATEAGHHLILCATSEDPAMESEYIDVLMQARAAGIVAVPTGANAGDWRNALEFGVEVVLIDRGIDGLPDVPTVTVDNAGGAFAGARHLIALGHRRIAILAGPENTTTGSERLAGYVAAHGAAGLEVDPELVKTGSFMREHAIDVAREVLRARRPPTAIFAANNVLGQGALSAITEAGLRLPDDISLIVFDDVPWTRQVTPAITVVSQPMQQLGRVGVQRLLESLGRRVPTRSPAGADDPNCLPVEVIVRDSCGPPRPLDNN